MALVDLRRNGMMSHLLDALEQGQSIGHYGRLVFAMVSRHFVCMDFTPLLVSFIEQVWSVESGRCAVLHTMARGIRQPNSTARPIGQFLD